MKIQDEMNHEMPSAILSLEGETYKVKKEENSDRSTTYIFQGEKGDFQMRVFQVFQGIKLVYHAVHVEDSFLGTSKKGNIIEICHCQEGTIERPYQDGCFCLTPGDLAINIVNRQSTKYYSPLRHYHGITISINLDMAPDCFSCFMKDIRIQPKHVARRLCGEEDCFIIPSEDCVEHIFSELYEVPCRDKINYFRIKILELLLILNDIDPGKNKLKKYAVSKFQVELARQVAEYLRENEDGKITIQDLCEKFHVSTTHLQNAFKGVFGMPVYSYMRTQKMQTAAIALIRTDRSVADIALETGYDNPSKFSAAFRNIMGETPLEYRKMHRAI